MAKKKQQTMKATKKGKAARKALSKPIKSKLPVSKQRLLDDIVDMLRNCDTWLVRQYHDQIYDDLDARTFSEPTARNLR